MTYAQYSNSSKFKKLINIHQSILDNIQSISEKLAKSYDVDSVSGELLNIIGRIVVQSRTYEKIGQIPATFAGTSELNNFSGPSEVQNFFNTPLIYLDAQLSDDIYRLFIKSKIVRNNYPPTYDNIVFALELIFPNIPMFSVLDTQDMSFAILVGGNFTTLDFYYISNFDFVLRPAGVYFRGFLVIDHLAFFNNNTFFGPNEQLNFFGGFYRGDKTI